MKGVLDELKSRLEDLMFEQRVGGGSTWKRAIGDALQEVNLFEEQRPGLVDFTRVCSHCEQHFYALYGIPEAQCPDCARSDK